MAKTKKLFCSIVEEIKVGDYLKLTDDEYLDDGVEEYFFKKNDIGIVTKILDECFCHLFINNKLILFSPSESLFFRIMSKKDDLTIKNLENLIKIKKDLEKNKPIKRKKL